MSDDRSRRLAQSEFERPVVVVAGAGTGKTTLLVARVAAWCVGPGWERHHAPGAQPDAVARRVIERVVAITFTEAAAAEMAQKIGLALLDLAAGELPKGWDPRDGVVPDDSAEVIRRAQALADESHRLQVSTIHAFCQRLLSTYPLEAGLHPRFEVDAEGDRLAMLVEQTIEESLRDLEASPNLEDWQRLAVEGVDPSRVAEALAELVAQGARPSMLQEDPCSDEAAARSTRHLKSALARFHEVVGDRLAGVSGPVSIGTRDGLIDLAGRLDGLGSSPSMDEIESVVNQTSPKAADRLKKWSRLGFSGSESSCFSEAAHEVAAASGSVAAILGSLVGLDRALLSAARAVLAPLLATVEERRSAAGIVGFADLLRRAAALLSASPGVCGEVVGAIDHLLVDEFQDTDDVQCRLVEALALGADIERRPSLFIVGDPKQSIYAWRSADLAAYDAFVGRVVDAGGVVVDLVRNFRSVTPILDEVARLVEPVMRSEEGIQPPFQRLEATDERLGAVGVDHPYWKTVEHWVAWPDGPEGVGPEKGSGKPETTALESRVVAADIRRLYDERVIERWGEVAVLLRVTTAQDDLLDAFRRLDIPYEVARERDYYRQREVVEIAALVRCLLEPSDTLALLTVLRSDVVGVPDVALAPLWDSGLPELMAGLDEPDPARLAAIAECIGSAPKVASLPRWRHGLQGAVEIIAELRRSLHADPPDVFVEKIRTLWLAEVTAAARYLGGFRRARIDRFLSDLEGLMAAGASGDAELARFLRLAVEQGKETRVPVPPDLEADAVHVMTIHRAKGLDFDHVYVAQIHKGGRGGGRRTEAAVHHLEDRSEYRLFGWSTPGFGLAEWQQERKTRAETVRLLYVAATRARKRLVVSGGWGPAGEEVPVESAADFGQLIARRLDQGSVAEQIGRSEERRMDAAPEVQRVMPVFGPPPDEARGYRKEQPGWAPEPEQLAAARTLATRREAAARRMEQPVLRSASAEAHQRLQRAEAEDTEPLGASGPDRELAMAIGTAIHELMEVLDLEGDLRAQVEQARSEKPLGEKAAAVMAPLLASIAGGTCLEFLKQIAPRLEARELPVMLWSEGEEGPGAVVSGFIDLVYRDPEDDQLVVADYKTDAVDGAALEERAKVYEPQVEVYARALREALDLEYEPHRELWFLHADEIVRL